jgi:hypothetical protein
MSCITKLLELKGDKEFLPVSQQIVIEGGGKYKDHEYLITFTSRGHRCGYVALSTEEAEKNKEDEIGLGCHGGITFFGNDHDAKSLLDIPCDDVWVGFDAMHHMDSPCKKTAMKYFESISRAKMLYMDETEEIMEKYGEHRTYEYMEQECKKIIDQLNSLS